MSKKSNKQKGDEYEKFTTEILMMKKLVWEDGVVFDNKDNEHKIFGKSGAEHQIDIHLTSTTNNEYHLLGECKCFNDPIEKTLACSFVTVMGLTKSLCVSHNSSYIIHNPN